MPVEDKYVNADLVASKLANPAFISGAEIIAMIAICEVAAADDNASVYRLFKNLTPNLIPIKIEISNDAITGGTDYDLGLYETGVGGAVVDADKLANTLDMSSAATNGSPKDGLENLNIDEAQEKLYELAGHTITTRKAGYDIALTANTVGTGAGTITVKAWFIQG